MEPPTGCIGTIDIARMGAVIIDLSGSSQTQPSPHMLATLTRKRFARYASRGRGGALSHMLRRRATIEPCLPRPAKEPPAGPGWIHEIKHDGLRILARRDDRGTRLFTRNGYNFADRCRPTGRALCGDSLSFQVSWDVPALTKLGHWQAQRLFCCLH